MYILATATMLQKQMLPQEKKPWLLVYFNKAVSHLLPHKEVIIYILLCSSLIITFALYKCTKAARGVLANKMSIIIYANGCAAMLTVWLLLW